MTTEKSCGTIILNDNKVLMVKQVSGFIGFPKGHMENGENEVDTAIRETKEETNIDVTITSLKRYAISYLIHNDTKNKTVVYFLAKPKENFDIIKQDAEISDIFWVDMDKVENYLEFDNIKALWKDIIKEIKI